MSRYLDRSMLKGEHIVYAAQLHWIVYHVGFWTTLWGALIGHFVPLLVRFLLGDDIASFVVKPIMYISIGIIVLGAFQLIFAFIRQVSTELVITNQRVIAKHGFISTTTFEVMLSKVEGANIDQTVFGRLLGYGTVMVKGTGGGISPIDHVADPYKFHARLMDVLRMTEAREQQPAAMAEND
jgi:uncharacterized membrane protein YdbT with pleckstrin-like domain